LFDLIKEVVTRGEAGDRAGALDVAAQVLAEHGGDPRILLGLARALAMSLLDLDDLNAAPPKEPIFEKVVTLLRRQTTAPLEDRIAVPLRLELANLARFLGRKWDPVVEECHAWRLAKTPDEWEAHYDLGLFCKTRGRFAEGQRANQRAAELGGADDQAVRWNLGICATGAHDAATALRVWQEMGQHLELGRFELPEGGYPMVKVRLAERPIAERSAERDDPGPQETIWLERLSPCHGVVRSPLYHDAIGVEYGDVVLFDGAPITHQEVGDRKVPVFPHLATVRRSGYHVFRFRGTQAQEGELRALTHLLPGDAILYNLSEEVQHVCPHCLEGHTDAHVHEERELGVCIGKLCAPPTLTPATLLEALDGLLAAHPTLRLFVPDLAEAAGLRDRAAFERRAFDSI
jgi:hypothetical protein